MDTQQYGHSVGLINLLLSLSDADDDDAYLHHSILVKIQRRLKHYGPKAVRLGTHVCLVTMKNKEVHMQVNPTQSDIATAKQLWKQANT